MAENTDSEVQAGVWLKPEQIDKMRTVCYDRFADYLAPRNEAIITHGEAGPKPRHAGRAASARR